MQTKEHEVEVEIGAILYTFTVRFHYEEGIYSIDPTEGTDTRLIESEIISPIVGYKHETGQDWEVTNVSEYEMVKSWADLPNKFDKA